MSVRTNLELALNGQVPEKTPLSYYSWMSGNPKSETENDIWGDQWRRLYDKGLGICHHSRVVDRIEHGIENQQKEERKNDGLYITRIKKTPLGEIKQVLRDGWLIEHWIKSPKDYTVWKWIVDNTELVPNYTHFEEDDEVVGDAGVVVVLASRTPAMTINVDLAGTETFCCDLGAEMTELYDLYESLKKLFIKETELVSKGPGRFVKWLENLTISMIGPKRYGDLLVPIYNECAPVLEKADKIVMVHYDGALNVIADQIAQAPFHIIESLTEPPEGDMHYDQCRKAWPDKAFWANINVELYYLRPEELKQQVFEKRQRVGKKGLAFELSEDLPSNWQESIPVVLEALNELD